MPLLPYAETLLGIIRRIGFAPGIGNCMCQKFVSGEINSTPIYCLPSRARWMETTRHSIAGSPTANASVPRTFRLNPFFRESSAAPLLPHVEFVCALCNESEAGTFRLLPQALIC